jgi:uncharacterized protein (DUF3084 family)
MSNPEAKFRSDVLRAQQSSNEAVSMRLASTEKATAANTEAISQLGTKIDKLADSISAQTQNIGRLERAVTDLVAGINAQRETMAQMMTQQSEFLKLATRQADIIGSLTAGRAS